MQMLGIELKTQLKKTFMHMAIFSFIIIATLILVRVLDPEGKSIKLLKQILLNAPQIIKESFSFLEIELMSIEMKIFLILMTVLSVPILYYSMTVALCSLEKEEDMGTICFLYNNTITRKNIILSKYLAGVISYLFNIIVLFTISTILIVSSYSKKISKNLAINQMINIWSAILVVGILLMTIGILYGAVKKKESNAKGFAIGWLLWSIIIGIVPYGINLIIELLNRVGKNIPFLDQIREKLDMLKYGSFVYWCNPIAVYKNGMGHILLAVAVVGILVIYVISVSKYNKREFGD